jgi:hypothetical protein
MMTRIEKNAPVGIQYSGLTLNIHTLENSSVIALCRCLGDFFLHQFFARGSQRIAFPGGFAKDA